MRGTSRILSAPLELSTNPKVTAWSIDAAARYHMRLNDGWCGVPRVDV